MSVVWSGEWVRGRKGKEFHKISIVVMGRWKSWRKSWNPWFGNRKKRRNYYLNVLFFLSWNHVWISQSYLSTLFKCSLFYHSFLLNFGSLIALEKMFWSKENWLFFIWLEEKIFFIKWNYIEHNILYLFYFLNYF